MAACAASVCEKGETLMTIEEFGVFFDKAGLPLSSAQKEALFQAWPMLQGLVARATTPMPRENEPSVIFQPEVK
jgi:hypothetical protein